MLTLLAYSMIVVFMALIMSGRVTALIALIVVPIAFAAIGGFGPQIGPMVIAGVRAIAPTGVLLLFAILYFGLMIDVGLFDPLIRFIVRLCKGDPMRVVVGSAILALIVSLDGDGSTTYLLCCSAMLPLHRRLGINPLILPCVTMLGNSIMNIAPWGGPTARVMSALHLDVNQVFIPLIPSMLMASLATIAIAWYLGLRERQRLQTVSWTPASAQASPLGGHIDLGTGKGPRSSRAKMAFNLVLTTVLMVMLVMGQLPLALLFMGAFAIAISVNFPDINDQKQRIASHAASALAVVAVIFAAGVFTGILSGTKMTDAIAQSVIQSIPASAGRYMPLITGLLSAPFTFFLSNDAFYFGVVPILAEAAKGYGIAPEVIARASLLGQPIHQLSPLVAANYVLMGVAGVEFGQHQRFTFKWAALLVLVMMVSAALFGVVPML